MSVHGESALHVYVKQIVLYTDVRADRRSCYALTCVSVVLTVRMMRTLTICNLQVTVNT